MGGGLGVEGRSSECPRPTTMSLLLILGNAPKLSLTFFLYAKSLEQGKRTLLCGLTGGIQPHVEVTSTCLLLAWVKVGSCACF